MREPTVYDAVQRMLVAICGNEAVPVADCPGCGWKIETWDAGRTWVEPEARP